MPAPRDDLTASELSPLFDENEQLRTALESSLEENARVIEDRDRLLQRVATLARELQAMKPAVPPAPPPPPRRLSVDEAEIQTKQAQTEEELRVAFEELQVVTEELEVANSGLIRANEDLEAKVNDRTRELTMVNGDLRRSEMRMNTLIEGMPQLVWRAVGNGHWTWCSPQWTARTGQSAEDSRNMGWLDALHPDDRQAALHAWDEAAAGGELSYAARLLNAVTGGYRHFQVRATPVRGGDGAVLEWLGTCTDIHDLIRLREQQAVLVGELQHRTRNLMAVVSAVMMRTLRGSTTLDDFRRCIDERLGALSRVQGLLSRRGTQRVSFDALLREELKAHTDLAQGEAEDRVLLDGPADVPLESSLVQTFALALHELATNAVKYGALSAATGKLMVTWAVVPADSGKTRLHVDWRESGVPGMPPAAGTPQGGGYGRELIERALPYQLGAKTTYGFTDEGVHCTIDVDVPKEPVEETAHERIPA